MTREEALIFLGYMLGRLGAGYHPDNQPGDYDCIADHELAEMTRKHDLMLATLGSEEVCRLCLKFLGW